MQRITHILAQVGLLSSAIILGSGIPSVSWVEVTKPSPQISDSIPEPILQIAQSTALSATEINAIASEITVRIAGPKGGSGVIVEKQGNTYYALTNWHVVNRVGDYEVHTPDGQRYSVYYSLIEQLPGLDLAIVPFTSNQSHRVATSADPTAIVPGSTLYVAGWTRSGGTLRQPLLFSREVTVTRRQQPQNGYTLVYANSLENTNLIRSGMSGGPILNQAGNLIGVNGIVKLGVSRDRIVAAGIEINRFLDWRKTASLPTLPQQLSRPPGSVGSQPPATNPSRPPAPNRVASPNLPSGNFALANSLRDSGEILSLTSLPSYAIGGNSNGTVTVWNLTTGAVRKTWQAHTVAVNSVAVSSDGRFLVTGCDDGTVKLWDLATGLDATTVPVLKTFKGHGGAVLSVAFSPDNQLIASGSWDTTVKLWDVNTGTLVRTLKEHSQLVSEVAFSPNGQRLVSAGKDKTVKLWNVSDGALIQTLQPAASSLSILSIAISPNGTVLASGGADGTLTLWNLPTGEPLRQLKGHTDGVWSVAISADGGTLVSGSWDRTVKLWDIATGELKGSLAGHSSYVNTVTISPDGNTIVSGGWEGQVKIWQQP
ncbi:MAG: trypsin-like peptidase domain-containing protein [Microcoleaceae cyanobacterium]